MSKNKKSLQDLTLLDRFLFAEVMEDLRHLRIYYLLFLEKISPSKAVHNLNTKIELRL